MCKGAFVNITKYVQLKILFKFKPINKYFFFSNFSLKAMGGK
jgi:hypothetical protein